MNDLRVGLIGESHTQVTTELTAQYMGSGTLEVFATPAMIAAMEAAATNALDGILDDGLSTVGIEINVRHMSATPMGEEVTAIAEVTEVEDRRVVFQVRAWDEQELIGEGTHVRYIIDIQRFLDRLQNK